MQLRDQIHLLVNRQQDQDVADQTLLALDTVLVMLMGALDAAAWVTHLVLGIRCSMHDVGWQKPRWRKHVEAHAPRLAALLVDGQSGRQVVTVLSNLRNAIHGPGLPPLAVGQSRIYEKTLVGLRKAKSSAIVTAVDSLGGQPLWGIHEIVPGRLYADPGLLVEQLIPRVLRLLDDLMRETPVERLEGVHIEAKDTGPPQDDRFGVGWTAKKGRSISLQLGLAAGEAEDGAPAPPAGRAPAEPAP